MFSVEFLEDGQIEAIHKKSMEILAEVGVDFLWDEAVEIFSNYGCKVSGNRVFFEEKALMELLKEAPSSFTLRARDPVKSVTIGKGETVLAPGYGAPFVVDLEGSNHPATLEDFRRFASLAYISDVVDITGGTLVEPSDLDEKGFLEMIYALITCSDKPLMGSVMGRKGALCTLDILSHLFEEERDPYVLSLINSLSPLKFDDRMLQAAIEYARKGQALIIASLMMAGSTGPTTLAGSLVVQNAEVLAGIALTQIINPGTPVIYGSASSITDMLTGSLAIGSPETSLFMAASSRLAHFYGLPVRGGGAMSDAKVLDAQAAYEAQMNMFMTQISGIDFALHSFGILQYYNAMSFEKFVVDMEIAGMVKRICRGFGTSEEDLALSLIKEVGPGGEFLTSEHTLLNYRQEFYQQILSDRQSFDGWKLNGGVRTPKRAREKYLQLLEEYQTPPLDEKVDKALRDYIQNYS